METIIAKKCYDAEVSTYYNEEHYDIIYKNEVKILREDGSILAVLKKNIIPENERETYKNIIRSPSRSKTKNRGSGAGYVDIRRFPKQAKELCYQSGEPLPHNKLVSVFYKDENGNVVNRGQSNQVRSGCAGYFDARGNLPCRKVSWSKNNVDKHNALIPLCKKIAETHKEVDELSYIKQKDRAEQSQSYIFKDSIYSTLTLNYDFRTAAHRDKGDFKAGLSTLIILEDIPNNYSGFYLGLPEYKIAFDVRDGDILFFDTHEIHANTEYQVLTDKLGKNNVVDENGECDYYYAGRMSIVAYLRERLYLCGD